MPRRFLVSFCLLSSGGAIETSVRSLGGGRVDEDGSGEVFAPQEMKICSASMHSREAADHVSGLMRHVRSRVSEFDLRFFSRAHRSKFHLLERDTTVPALKEIKPPRFIPRVRYTRA